MTTDKEGELRPRRRSDRDGDSADEAGRLWLIWLGLGLVVPPSVSVCSPNKLSTRFPISSRSSIQFFCRSLFFIIRFDNPVALCSKPSSAGESEDKTAVIEDFVANEDCKRVFEISSACTLRANKESR